MRDSGALRLMVNKKKAAESRVLSACVLLVLACFSTVSSMECPENCICRQTTVECIEQHLSSIPQPLPSDITILSLPGNYISHLTRDSFPVRLDQLKKLYLSGNRIEQVDPGVFDNLPSLSLLDLSNNIILNFSQHAFPRANNLTALNLSRSFHNSSTAYFVSNILKDSVPKLRHLNLSNNELWLIPKDLISGLSELITLDLRSNAIVSIKNANFTNNMLNYLDLRDNALKDLSNGTLTDLSQISSLHVYLAGNPWLCDCEIEDMVMWLKISDFVKDKKDLTCEEPTLLKNTTLLQLEGAKLLCTYSGDMKGVLETSYVFLGMVLALIGVIFLLVLYLNRKGIKRWMYNIRDACRDHMEGYHYRYEINSDPRLANLSLNSDV